MHKIILYILIGFGVTSCSTPTTNEESETQPVDEKIVSMGFIGQTFSNKSTDSFGQTKQEFSFEKNGIGTYYVAWTVSATLHEDLGEMSWEINEGKIHVHYTYKSSDGITSSEEDVFIYNKQRNELISTSNNSKIFNAVHSNSGSKQNDKAHEFSKKLSGISDDNQSFKDKTYFIQTDYSYIENNGSLKKQNNKIISWRFEVTNDLVKILMLVGRGHEFTGHYISNSQLEMRKSDGRKYCIFKISNNQLLQIFASGETWHHRIQNRWQEGGDSYDEAEHNHQQEQAEYESSQAYYNSENENSLKVFTDQSGNSFNSIKIGNQSWMDANLNVDKFQNGDPIPQAITMEEWKKAGETNQPAWCYYNNDASNSNKYGRLYNQYAVNDSRGIAPKGWHVSSEGEFEQLCKSIAGRCQKSGVKMKSSKGWSNSGNGDNSSGFNAYPAGLRGAQGDFSRKGESTFFWSSSRHHTNGIRLIQDYSDFFDYYNSGSPNNGFSVRCIKD